MANGNRGSRDPHRRRLKRLRQDTMGDPQGARNGRKADAVVDCGWGRLIFGHTFGRAEDLVNALRAEGPDRRDIAFYVPDPQVALALAPQEIFLDPSVTFRLDFTTYRVARKRRQGFSIRRLTTRADAEAVNRIYAERGMVTVAPDFFWSHRDARTLTVLVAEDAESGEILGTVMGVDHARAFDDPERGSSLWCLAVSAKAPFAGIGESLVRRLAEQFQARGAAHMDLSVLHDNEQAIALYEKLGFRRVQVYALKRKNQINEKLFVGKAENEGLNPYAAIIVDEARRRGIGVEVFDAAAGLFRLSYGGRAVRCRESLSEFTSAVAMSICDDKRVTSRLVRAAGVAVPAQVEAGDAAANAAFLAEHGSVVVKPARGEQGTGVAAGLTTEAELAAAVARAREVCADVLIEQCFEGEDLRLIVIDYRVVAAAMRRPARIVGDGVTPVSRLIEAQSRRRAAATGGESRIPLDAETERCIAAAGYGMDSVLEAGQELTVRKTANLHTGGTIVDVTSETHPALIDAAIRAARAIEIPVTGIDLMVKSPRRAEYVFIEANERPGLANHEPQPTAERFVDLLFPLSIPASARELQWRSAT
ncbi:N-acetylglutaminylglutamine synthetase [Paralimibaculum aggregatum]|uniref:N-acetylglutaminylglutamine synthetase n=1 Tax=Paralimibaculum aggregatum TaxID=3036245 RepID=A0ABQ6LRB9_9RHOB|nr:N-acetylglutaminylglutamine synthetase [Limibaculum sp. NKW23]GMG83560.1 N-acetylglutaminylglutamine synthetase [Limibaculum sp. NKW23]